MRAAARKRLGLTLVVGVGGLFVLGLLWIIVTAFLVHERLTELQEELAAVKTHALSGDVAALKRDAARAVNSADDAQFLTSGPAWWFAANLPWAGEPFQSVRGISGAVDDLVHTSVPQLVDLVRALDPKTLRDSTGRIDVAAIQHAEPVVASSLKQATDVRLHVGRLPADTWLSPVDHGRATLLSKLDGLIRALSAADRATRVLPTMLGASKPQTYFVGFLNEAEIRGTGGLPGAFIVMRADHGAITMIKSGSDSELAGVHSGVTPTPDFAALYGAGQSWNVFQNSTMSPHFPDVAQIWAGMWQRKSGQHVDGAIAIDPSALGYLLEVTGPAKLPDGTSVTSRNVVALTQQTVYAKFRNSASDPAANAARRRYLLEIATAAEQKIVNGRAPLRGLIKAARRGAGERRIVVWSGNHQIEDLLSGSGFGGTVALTSFPYTGLAVQNAAANKLSYYLKRSLTYETSECSSVRDVTVTVTLTNTAPKTGLSVYASGGAKDGLNRVVVQVYSTLNATLTSATLNGRPRKLGAFKEQQHAVFLTLLDLPSGVPQTLVLHIHEAGISGPLTVLNPPGVQPMTVRVVEPKTCGD